MLERLRFYCTLVQPRGRTQTIATLGSIALWVLSVWRDEGPATAQPPKLIADVLDWLPWSAWGILAVSVAIAFVIENTYRLTGGLRERITELEAILDRDDLIRATPNKGSGSMPVRSNTVTHVLAYLDVKTADCAKPLRSCRVKLIDLYHYSAYTDLNIGKVVERWDRDHFHAGQTWFFPWSGRTNSVDAVDIHSSERAVIASCLETNAELMTTGGPAGHIFHGDQYRLAIEITADNCRPFRRDYWLQLHQGDGPVIEEWDDSRTTWQCAAT